MQCLLVYQLNALMEVGRDEKTEDVRADWEASNVKAEVELPEERKPSRLGSGLK